MVMYARSDVLSVHQGEGGCGIAHTRPRRGADGEGDFVPVWGIDCPPCEAGLDEHQWSRTRHKIPLTPDEEEEMKELAERTRAEEERQRLRIQQDMAMTRAEQLRTDFRQPDPQDVAITKSEAAPRQPGTRTAVSTAADYAALDKGSLRDLARDRGLVLAGTKDDLVARLVDHDNSKE